MSIFFYVYILESELDGKNYTGYTKDLNLRLSQHNNGYVESTKNRRPLKLIYFEACLSQKDALKREKYFKTYYGKMFLKKDLNGISQVKQKEVHVKGTKSLYTFCTWR